MGTLPPAPVVRYGEHPSQLANLHLPAGRPPFPAVALLHGGFWRDRWDRTLLTHLAADLAGRGYAAWNVEFRRVGEDGGGWPGTVDDVRRAIDALSTVPEVDATRISAIGHSAGGQLALAAACGRSDVAAVFGLAALTDLERSRELDADAVDAFLGGPPEHVPARYAAASPRSLLPLGVRSVLVHGVDDAVVPAAMSIAFVEAAHAAGDDAELVLVSGADHFDVIDPRHEAWREVGRRLERMWPRSAGDASTAP